MAEHTEGPWWIWDETHVMAGKGNRAGGMGERLVANCGGTSSNVNRSAVRAENAANARMIAAAPETAVERDRLREALERVLEHFKPSTTQGGANNKGQFVATPAMRAEALARAALATAKQKEPADV